MREQLASDLYAAGHDVVTVPAMRAAPRVLREGGIDLVFVDCLDDAAGLLELARVLEGLPDAPAVLLVSGSLAAPEISVRIGAAAFLPKPCDLAELAAAVARLVGGVRPVKLVDDESTGPRHYS
jgi:DNA-binding response OmpR family regulator